MGGGELSGKSCYFEKWAWNGWFDIWWAALVIIGISPPNVVFESLRKFLIESNDKMGKQIRSSMAEGPESERLYYVVQFEFRTSWIHRIKFNVMIASVILARLLSCWHLMETIVLLVLLTNLSVLHNILWLTNLISRSWITTGLLMSSWCFLRVWRSKL